MPPVLKPKLISIACASVGTTRNTPAHRHARSSRKRTRVHTTQRGPLHCTGSPKERRALAIPVDGNAAPPRGPLRPASDKGRLSDAAPTKPPPRRPCSQGSTPRRASRGGVRVDGNGARQRAPRRSRSLRLLRLPWRRVRTAPRHRGTGNPRSTTPSTYHAAAPWDVLRTRKHHKTANALGMAGRSTKKLIFKELT